MNITPDTAGIALVIVSALLYFLVKDKDKRAAEFCLLLAGVGVGVLVGAWWTMENVKAVLLGG